MLRNQIVHGCAAEDTVRDEGTVKPAIDILESLLPILLRLMIREGTGVSWLPSPYPAAGTPHHPFQT